MFKYKKSLLAIIVCFSMLCAFFPSSVYAKSIDELQQEIAQYQKELDKLNGNAQNQIKYQNTLTKQISALSEKIRIYESQINDLNSQMDEKQNIINDLNDQINDNQQQIDVMQKDIDVMESEKKVTQDQLRARMRENYISGKTTILDVLLSSQDFGQFISNIVYVEKIADHDKKLHEKLDEQVAEINAEKNKVETKVAEINANKNLVVASLDEIKKQSIETNNIKEQMNSTSNSLSAQLAKSNQESQAIKNAQAQIEKAKHHAEEELEDETSGGSDIKPDPSGYLFPVAKPCYISQPYKGAAHKGIDIATYGKPNKIYASRDGVVTRAEFGKPGSGLGGYGNVVKIDHGDGFITLYAHMSSYCVRVGQKVKQGECIGYVGSSGQSTGFHCHFELRVKEGKSEKYLRPPF